MASTKAPTPEGVFSILDTDLYKLTMQSAILKYFPDCQVSYRLTNRTPHMKLSRGAFRWLSDQIAKLENVTLTADERAWLTKTCPYLSEVYLEYLQGLRLRPMEQVQADFTPERADGDDSTPGEVSITVHGLWVETILYEIPLLALVSEAYFKFVDREWRHDGQVAKARQKGAQLLEHGCMFSEFGSRRRRDYQTHEMVIDGLCQAQRDAAANGKGWTGKFTGTSNVHFAMRFGIAPIGTVAHEWFMGIAALTGDYANANELALRFWIGTFGRGVLSIALTDTFGTPAFLDAFVRPAPRSGAPDDAVEGRDPTYAEIFTGVRQDSGDPLEFVQTMRDFYRAQGITAKKTVVFSDSLNIDRCITYKDAADAAGLAPSFGIGTFFTNDFHRLDSDEKSVPLNIVIKLSEARGRPAIKLSDDKGKNMGDGDLMRQVKAQVGYEERVWKDGDEAHRWDKS